MNSPRKINYELRPAKFTERKMLLASLTSICRFYNLDYQYIGFGGLSFTDFKLFHKELHINKMTSIEGGDLLQKERVEFNRPFSFINLEYGLSTTILTKLNLSEPSIIWLDYDNALENHMFEDISIIFRKLPAGSIYIFTSNRELKDKNTGNQYEVESFSKKFGSLIPFDVKNVDFSGTENYKTIRKMLLGHINSFIDERNLLNENLKFYQLFNFLYQENGGAKMYTFGGVIDKKNSNLTDSNINNFEFIELGEEPHRINIPNLTIKESEYIDKNFDDEDSIIESRIIEEHDLKKYKQTYKYLPNYFDVRL
ncbi:hypothetical protein J0656_18525 [Muricauda ruestringensis]|uniref:Uncharacterized protein n=1 Tax=Flagellimonas aurea TaxID=2915619 RepID=A0ABS3G9E6_9FLAO|nr:O-methyltransferase [Allomuricauda aurea]MBO0356020.1 hypothetical protein [Allomuricauda aurea]